MGAHTTSDDPTRYRILAELEEWERKDPIDRLRTYLLATKAADQAWIESIDTEADVAARELRDAVLSMFGPTPVSIFDHVYQEPHPLIDEERADMVALIGAEEAGSLK